MKMPLALSLLCARAWFAKHASNAKSSREMFRSFRLDSIFAVDIEMDAMDVRTKENVWYVGW